MSSISTLAEDKIGGCRYAVTVKGRLLTVTLRGYGLKAVDTQKISHKRNGHFNYDAEALTQKMVLLERRMRELARLTTVLKANSLTGVARLSKASEARPAKKVKSLKSLFSKI